VQQPLPLKIGAMQGPGSFRLAGEIADGVHVACGHSAQALAYAAEAGAAGGSAAPARWWSWPSCCWRAACCCLRPTRVCVESITAIR
jgi:5,10-methylenetetrahydromethanopterin reductase